MYSDVLYMHMHMHILNFCEFCEKKHENKIVFMKG